MATVHWRIRATAVRPSFSTNYSAVKDLTVVRSFSNEVRHGLSSSIERTNGSSVRLAIADLQALEFQQTLEIENVWPEKLNYAVVSNHVERLLRSFRLLC
jgi:arrestin-related trafficking adapter 4/5/7